MIKKIFMYSLLIFAQNYIHGAQPQEQSFVQKMKSALRNGTNSLLSSGDASEANTEYTHALFRQIDEENELPQVKKMNKLFEYLLGYKNTMVLPGLDQIYINENWVNQLPEEQKRFVLGRCLAWIKNGKSYLATQAIMGLATQIFAHERRATESALLTAFQKYCGIQQQIIQKVTEKGYTTKAEIIDDQEIKNLQAEASTQYNFQVIDQSDNLYLYINILHLIMGNKCITNHIHRNINYNADAFAAEKFDCAQGGVDVMHNIALYKNDATILGKIFSSIPLTYLASYWIEIKQLGNRLRDQMAGKEYKPSILATISLAALKTIAALPGRLHNSPNAIGNAVKNLPLVNLGSSFPQKNSRISALQGIKNNIAS